MYGTDLPETDYSKILRFFKSQMEFVDNGFS